MEWTLTKKKAPKSHNRFGESEYLLCKGKDNSVPFVGWYNVREKIWRVAYHTTTSDPVDVTHWMPLPDPPKEN